MFLRPFRLSEGFGITWDARNVEKPLFLHTTQCGFDHLIGDEITKNDEVSVIWSHLKIAKLVIRIVDISE